MSSRITYLEQGSAFEVHIKTRKNWFLLVLLPIWLAVWTFAGISVLFNFTRGEVVEPVGLNILWLILWAFSEVFLTFIWFWNASGKEIVKIAQGKLSIKRDLFGLGLTKTFQVGEVHNLRAAGLFGTIWSWSASVSYWGISGGNVAFSHKGKTRRFGIELEEEGAIKVVERLNAHLNL